MVDQGAPVGPAAIQTDPTVADSVTRGFLFADLRGYTDFVDARGATAAAELLSRYRQLARDAIQRFDGAEIKTEGDSFYVVFSSVSGAVRCGLAIVEAAGAPSQDHPEAPIRVGIGIHAGETVEAEGGYVGAPVNIAARICAQSASGEVLVSDTVRALTQSVLPVRFEAKGRRQLKGVAEPVALYAVTVVGEGWAGARSQRLSRRRWVAVLAGGVLVLVLLAGAWYALRPQSGLPPGPWKIGVDLPLSGQLGSRSNGILEAVQLAVDTHQQGGGTPGATITVDALDHGDDSPQAQNTEEAVANTNAFVADPRVVAMIGPSSSRIASAEIPLTNAPGLLQCSPANTDPGLTKPRDGALDLRSAAPNRINYVRTAPSDDIQGKALASFILNDLGASKTLVVDDAADGRSVADDFTAAYTAVGGSTIRRALNPGADPRSVLDSLSAPDAPGAVFFGGFTETGAPQLRAAMAAGGHGDVPFLNWDGIQDGSGADDGSYIQLTGASAVGTYIAHASTGPPKAGFTERYRAAFGTEPIEYAAAAYACAQVITEALRSVAKTGPSADALREAVRAYAVDTSHRYETVLGTVGFDANGDSLQQFVTFYRVDPSAAGGKGDWVIHKQQDYGPAP